MRRVVTGSPATHRSNQIQCSTLLVPPPDCYSRRDTTINVNMTVSKMKFFESTVDSAAAHPTWLHLLHFLNRKARAEASGDSLVSVLPRTSGSGRQEDIMTLCYTLQVPSHDGLLSGRYFLVGCRLVVAAVSKLDQTLSGLVAKARYAEKVSTGFPCSSPRLSPHCRRHFVFSSSPLTCRSAT